MGCRLVAKQFIPRATSHETKVPWVYNVSHVTFFAAKKKAKADFKDENCHSDRIHLWWIYPYIWLIFFMGFHVL